ncbi:DUF7146 domain-containing protein [Methylocystis parvus]|uniref:DUF7146 domain-containing protein n=1 Tax=Methylocystis parvus TaxID=134 RepID=A0A6B8LV58_9HYPH|nr:toprim domain-containing protein [Methylocystis parvus]QGM96257.1 hypothetical protein F7D14_01335 [Methylocystis parvus]WBJ99906.1 toprim domain-containing protein [Methylocystis parvus OBBP]
MSAKRSTDDYDGPVHRQTSSHECESENDRQDRRRDLPLIRDALNDRAVELVSYLLGAEPNRRLSNRRAKRWGRKGSFALALTGRKRGLYYDHEAQEGGDLFHLIRKYAVRDFAGAVQWACDWLGWGEGHAPEPRKSDMLRRERQEREAREAARQAAEDAKRAAIAKRKFAEARPIEGTPGEVYLRETRGIDVAAFPDAFRWHEGERAVICAVTKDDGEVVAAQMIAVTPDGKKDVARWPDKGGAKTSIGPVGNGAVRLPGPANGPVCICEGPETGLTIWAATGYETLILLGGLRRAERMAPAGRRVILCKDDDKRISPSGNSVRSALRALRAKGIDVREATPFEIRRGDKRDFNDLVKESGLAAVRERIHMVAIDSDDVTQFISIDDARAQVDERVRNFFDLVEAQKAGEAETDEPSANKADDGDGVRIDYVGPPHVHALGITVGVGKTEAALRHARRTLVRLRAAGDNRAIVIAVPEHRLSDEVAARFREMTEQAGLSFEAEVWRGREADLPGGENGEKMCADIESVRLAQKHFAQINEEVCLGKGPGGEHPCAYLYACAYRDQFDADADLWVVSHQILFHPFPPAIEGRGVAAIVVDESPWQAGLIGVEGSGIEVELSWMCSQPVPPAMDGERLRDIRGRLAWAVTRSPDGPLKRAALHAVGFDNETGPFAELQEWRRKQNEGNWRERIENASLHPLMLIWKAVADLMNRGGPEASGRLAIVRRKEDGVRVLRVSGLASINEDWRVPTLLIDAVLDVELVRPFWPNIVNLGQFDVSAANQVVRQATGKSWAKSSLEPPKSHGAQSALNSPANPDAPSDDKHAARAETAARARRRVHAISLKRERELGGKLLVIGNKAVVQAMQFPPDVNVGHFGAIAGHDEWRDVRLVVILGRPMPAPQQVERMAGAMTGAAPETTNGEWYGRGDAYRLKREGNSLVRVLAETDIHPDPIAERMRQRICIGELVQAIGRGRGVNRQPDDPVEILVLGDAILPVPVDEFLPDDSLWPSPTDQMLAEGGVAFEDGTSAAMAYPMLWRTAGAARMALQRARGANRITNQSSVTISYNELSIGECDGARPFDAVRFVRFQRAGNGQEVQRACYDARRIDDPHAEIERMVGPLVMFEAEGQEATPEAVGATLASRILAALADGDMPRNELRRKVAQRTPNGEFAEAIATLLAGGDIAAASIPRATGGKPTTCYRLAGPQAAPATVPDAEDLPFVSVENAVIVDGSEPAPVFDATMVEESSVDDQEPQS